LRPPDSTPPGVGSEPVRLWTVLGVLAVILLPFMNRSFHIDDPLFIWIAKQIQAHPGDPFGFSVNWDGSAMAMSDITKNPPLASYYLAGIGWLLGWREVTLHLALLPFALVAVAGTYTLAKSLCGQPALATFAATVTPVFVVSSITVMCDVMMLACWVWAVHAWTTGLERRNHLALGSAAVLMTAAALSKYFGIMLIPLLLAHALYRERRVGWWILYFAVPIAAMLWYEHVTAARYGHGMLLDAAAYATENTQAESGSVLGVLSVTKTWVTLTFTGGCVATLVFFAPRLWSGRVLVAGVAIALASAAVIFREPALGAYAFPASVDARWRIALQFGCWGTAGLSLLALAILDFFRRRDANSLLLLLWIVGTFLFAGFVNWVTNARSLLPLAVPAGILMARRMESRGRPVGASGFRAAIVPLAAAALLAIAVAWSDSALARSQQLGAEQVVRKYARAGRTVWFEGHWGFQYYMEQLGAQALDEHRSSVAKMDLLVMPAPGTDLFHVPDWAHIIDAIRVPSSRWLVTMNRDVGAGFYAHAYGPLPFVMGPGLPSRFTVYEASRDVALK
jgi:4-amino-4-deoxy-L-arabinose transferase-like glycosyltransferase